MTRTKADGEGVVRSETFSFDPFPFPINYIVRLAVYFAPTPDQFVIKPLSVSPLSVFPNGLTCSLLCHPKPRRNIPATSSDLSSSLWSLVVGRRTQQIEKRYGLGWWLWSKGQRAGRGHDETVHMHMAIASGMATLAATQSCGAPLIMGHAPHLE